MKIDKSRIYLADIYVGEEVDKNDFKKYNKQVNKKAADVASHIVIEKYIKKNGKDYRYQTSEHPIKDLQSCTEDNIQVGRL